MSESYQQNGAPSGRRLLGRFVDKMIEIRKKTGMTRYELAVESRLMVGYVEAIECREQYPTVATAIAISSALGMDFADMFCEAPRREIGPSG